MHPGAVFGHFFPGHRIRSLILSILTLLWAGCSALPPQNQPAIFPTEDLPTIIGLTIEAGQNPAQPSLSPSAIPTEEPALVSLPIASPSVIVSSTPLITLSPELSQSSSPSPLPTRTPSPSPTAVIPNAAIQILAPGPGSKVTSPIRVNAYLKPVGKGNVRVELLGEEGEVLGRITKDYFPGIWMHILTEMDFEIPGVAEASRLQISTEDSYGRAVALSSVDLVLLSVGEKDVNPSGSLIEPIQIQEPAARALVQGGRLHVSGLARPQGADPLLIEMIGTDGKYIGPSKYVDYSDPDNNGYRPFQAEVPYSISSPTWVLVIVTDRGDRLPGPTHLSSVEVLLSP